MKLYIKVAIAFFALLFGVVTLMEYLSKPSLQNKFHLIDQVQEVDIAYHTDIIKVLDEAILYNSEEIQSVSNKVGLNKLKNQLVKSGLNLETAYFTHSFGENAVSSLYLEVLDTALFELAFKQFSTLLKFSLYADSSNTYLAMDKRSSAEKHLNYIKINFGKGAEYTLNKKSVKPSAKFKQLLENANTGLINTTGTPHLDSIDYATFVYSYNKVLDLKVDWHVSDNHPLKLNKTESIQTYPTHKSNLRFFTNFDKPHFQRHVNSFIKEKGATEIEKLPRAARAILTLWNGQTSIQMGGKSAQKTVQYITEFDDDFNQTEKKVVKVDSIPNLGFLWKTNNPKETLALLDQLPNVKLESDKLQIALLPSLIINTEEQSIKASVQSIEFKEGVFKQILFLNIETYGIEGQFKIEKTSDTNVRFHIIMKDWKSLSDPKRLSISSFW